MAPRLQSWLDRKIAARQTLCWLGAAAALALGAIVLYLTFWCAYGVIWFTTSWWITISHEWLLTLSAAFVVLLFIGNATTDRTYLEKIELNLGPHRDVEVAVARATGHGWILAFTDAKAAHSALKMFTTLLYTGPRTVLQAWRLLLRARQLKQMDRVGCARIIHKALKAKSRLTFDSLLEHFRPDELAAILPALSLIDGVVILRTDPPGITLSPSLVDELADAE